MFEREDTNMENESLVPEDPLAAFELPELPDEMELEPNQRVVAIGDIHGNLSFLKYCLKAANLIEGDSDDWVGGNTILVQLGDLLDRGAFEVEVLKLLAKLGDQAKAAGGVVAVIWGNHEIFNACKNFTCSYHKRAERWTNEFNATLEKRFGSEWTGSEELQRTAGGESIEDEDPARWLAFRPGGLLAKPFLSKLKVMMKVGRTIFVHGGFFAEQVEKHGGLASMNAQCREWILDLKNDESTLPEFVQTTSFSNTTFTRYFSHPPNSCHYPTLSSDKINERAEKAKNALASVDADRMVVGHTVQESINASLDGRVWRIDVGNGVPRRFRHLSNNADPSTYRYEALEISNVEGKEEVAVLRHVLRKSDGSEYENTRTVHC